jgi:hypothetical protein
VPKLKDRIVLSADQNGFRCRAPIPIAINGSLGSQNEVIAVGAHVEAGPVTFTLTEAPREGGTR